MPKVSVSYRFSQLFKAPASEVFAWATDYDVGDIERMGFKGKRNVSPLCDGAVVLSDTVIGPDGTKFRKKKLVRIDAQRLRWTNTHLAGPLRHSQFLYEVVPESETSCRLDFTGLQLEDLEPSSKAIAARAKELRREDSALWKNLARAFASERKQASR